MRRISSTPQPVTPERIERALDRVAEIIVARPDGEAWLPFYEHLEEMLEDCRSKASKLEDIGRRARRAGSTAAKPGSNDSADA